MKFRWIRKWFRVMVAHIVLVITILISSLYVRLNNGSGSPERNLDVYGIVEHHGYPLENHVVMTEDGYLLEIHRLPHGRKRSNSKSRPAVLMLSGLLCSSADWIYKGANDSLGFILADLGFDVWMGNNRGTTKSRKHTKLDPDVDRKEFWNFSFHEMGLYDIPAMIDYILTATQQEKLFYIGHSQGMTSFFAMLSEKPEYNEKVKMAAALAPAIVLKNSNAPILSILIPLRHVLQSIADTFHQYEFLPYTPILKGIGQMFCQDYSPFKILCKEFFYFIIGRSDGQFDESLIPVVVSNTPAGSSFKQVMHYLQLRTGNYTKYDYGKEKNLILYEQENPPEYDLSKAKIPVTIFQGDQDGLSSHEDVEIMSKKLPNVISKKILPGFTHLDVVWGNDATKLIFNDIVETMRKYL